MLIPDVTNQNWLHAGFTGQPASLETVEAIAREYDEATGFNALSLFSPDQYAILDELKGADYAH